MGRVLAEQARQLRSGISNGLLGPLSDFSRVFPGSSASKAHFGITHTQTHRLFDFVFFCVFLRFFCTPFFEGGLSNPFS